MIMFSVVRGSGARMTRYNINHSVESRERQGGGWGVGGLEGVGVGGSDSLAR